MNGELLVIHELQVGHAGRPVLPPVSLTVLAGQAWAIVGPNGAGKSTLLRTLLGLQPPISGTMRRTSCGVGYVPQRHELDPSVPGRVLDLVRAGAEQNWSFVSPLWPFTVRRRVQAAMHDTRVLELAREDWRHLSEGQKQRVLVAQALAGEPRLLVLDEPTSAMDMASEAVLFGLLHELRLRRELGLLVISHHLALLGQHATHLLFLDKDEGVVRAGRLAEVAQDPAFVQRYGLLMHRPAGGDHA